MANHLTPEELAKELNMDRETVIRLCVSEGVPIYQGKIDKGEAKREGRGGERGRGWGLCGWRVVGGGVREGGGWREGEKGE